MIPHRPDCTRSAVLRTFTGKRGDPMRICPECSRWEVIEDRPDPAPRDVLPMPELPDMLKPLLPAECYGPPQIPEAEPVKPERPEPLSPYRCRVHHRRPVDRKGRGCTTCAEERAKSPRESRPRPIRYANSDPFAQLDN